MNIKKNILLFSSLIPTLLYSYDLNFSCHHISPHDAEITIHIDLHDKELLYNDSLKINVDNPSITLSPLKSSTEPLQRYDHQFKKTKTVYEKEIEFVVTAHTTESLKQDSYLHVTVTTNKAGPEEHILKLCFDMPIQPGIAQETSEIKEIKNSLTHTSPSINQEQSSFFNFSISDYISILIKTITSPFIRLLLVYLLGILLSLTPCIYPMIPITIGILQAQGSKSLWYNILVSLAYTCGIATTFAFFGLLAGCAGPLCGQLLVHPVFIVGLVLVLGYLGLSMMGFYEIKMPQFLMSSQRKHNGSLISSFVMGMASGTIASPCVSPGLAMLLSIVVALGSKLAGFLMLFAFGIGLSTPLLIVGTFSSSLNMMPRAGMWMVEIKKIFGFMIFGMCFYYLNYIIPMPILIWLIALFALTTGLYYIYSSKNLHHSHLWKKINLAIGILVTASSIVIFSSAVRMLIAPKTDFSELANDPWYTDYQKAREQALNENKKLFVDFWALFCPVCLAINKKILTKPAILKTLDNHVLLKVDGTHKTNEPYASIKDKFNVIGFPTFLLIDPQTEAIIKQWGGEIYDMSDEQLIKELA